MKMIIKKILKKCLTRLYLMSKVMGFGKKRPARDEIQGLHPPELGLLSEG